MDTITPELLADLKKKAERAEKYATNEIVVLGPKGYVKFVFAVTPAVVLALIAGVKRREKLVELWRRDYDALASRFNELEKEADWLATRLQERDEADYRDGNMNEISGKKAWREAARRAVEGKC